MNVASSSRTQLLRWISPSASRSLILPRAFATEAAHQPSFDVVTSETSRTSTPSKHPSSKPTPEWKLEGRKRPSLSASRAETNPNHPLYALFRRIEPTEEELTATPDASVKHVPFEPYWAPDFESGMFNLAVFCHVFFVLEFHELTATRPTMDSA